jgi:esterase/lipase superfamily enzyme/V8-like Glu-specific endopeptidase
MSNPTVWDSVRELIRQQELVAAIETLEGWLKGRLDGPKQRQTRDWLNELILHVSSARAVQIKSRRGIVTGEQAGVEIRQISNSILLVTDEIEREDLSSSRAVPVAAQAPAQLQDGRAEKIIGSKSHLQMLSWLEKGLQCGTAVCRLVSGGTLGTGFRVQGDLIVTNHHVIESAAAARQFSAQFFFEERLDRTMKTPITVALDPGRFWTSEDLDITIVGAQLNSNDSALTIASLILTDSATVAVGDVVSIIQHPLGGPKQVALTSNEVISTFDHRVQYITDTLPGSSGAPVFNTAWDVVAVHHAGGNLLKSARGDHVFANEGVSVGSFIDVPEVRCLIGTFASQRTLRVPLPAATEERNKPGALAQVAAGSITMSASRGRTLGELLTQLQAAVRDRNLVRARELEQIVLQRLTVEIADGVSVECRVRALMLELERALAKPPAKISASFESESIGSSVPSDGVVFPVWFGTNRKAASGGGFTGERHDRVICGRAEVYVPETHRFGGTGTAFWKRLLRFELRDDQLRLQHVETQEPDTFFGDIRNSMQAATDNGEEPHALLFLHGFNVSFEDAAIRAAQIGYDLKVTGATAFFSWPSRGSVVAYPADEASIEASERAITNFLVDFSANCGAKKVHVIAHSMGNRGLLRALQRIAANAETQGRVKFGQIFLAAPDVDRDLFLDLAHLYSAHAERTTLYTSSGDRPVHLSSKLHDAPRAGYFTPYTVAAGIDTVAVPNFDIDLLGHSYFAQAEGLLHDIYDLVRHNEPPARRQRIEPEQSAGAAFWKLRR